MGAHKENFVTEHVARTIINLANYDRGHHREYNFTQLINSISGLLILPVEYLKKNSNNSEKNKIPFYDIKDEKLRNLELSFAKNISNDFQFNLNNDELTFNKFIVLIRNAFSHFNLEPINHGRTFVGLKIWNKSNGQTNFEMNFERIDLLRFILFLSELFLANLSFNEKNYPEFKNSVNKLKIKTGENQIVLLDKCLREDDDEFTSELSSFLFSNIIKNNDIESLLIKGIYDKEKSNRLRERFFWVFSHNYTEKTKSFYEKDLKIFISENYDNLELIADIIDYAHWTISKSDIKLKEIVRSEILAFCDKRPNFIKELSNSTVELFGLTI
jgi:hypothetical protein